MQNAPYLDVKTQDFLDNFQQDFDIELFGKETEDPDFVEAACSWNGHHVGYREIKVSRLTFVAEGFKWAHPNGAIVSGMFSEPVKAIEVLMDADRDELDSGDFIRELRNAIIAKCGNISGFADSNLI